jgi:hypothetical protein
MRTLFFAAIVITSGLGVFAQGTVTFNNRVPNVATSHVWAGGSVRSGNGPGDVPTGSTDWTGYSLIGTTGGPFAASTTFAQLLGAPGLNAPESSMLPSLTPPTTFRTGAAAGNIVGNIATFANIPKDAPVATFEMVVWDNSSGLYPTWTSASDAVRNWLIVGGTSAPFMVQSIGGDIYTPPLVVSSIPGQGLQSFSLATPEPTTVVITGLGAVLLIFRRRK